LKSIFSSGDSAKKLEVEWGSPQFFFQLHGRLSEGLFRRVFGLLGDGRRFDFFFASALGVFSVLITIFGGGLQDFAQGDVFIKNLLAILPMVGWVSFVAGLVQLSGRSLRQGHYLLLSLLTFVLKAFFIGQENLGRFLLLHLVLYGSLAALLFVLDLIVRRSPQRAPSLLWFFAPAGAWFCLWWIFLNRIHFPTDQGDNSFYLIAGVYIMPLLVFWDKATSVLDPAPIFSVQRLGQIVFPVQQIAPFPLAIEEYSFAKSEKQRRTRLQGLSDLLVAAMVLVAFQYTSVRLNAFLGSSGGPLKVVRAGMFFYVLRFFRVFMIFRFYTGFARCLGLSVRDGFNYGLFAVSPVDIWKRWSIYYYEWMRDRIFFPMRARKMGLFLSLFCTFSISCLLHVLDYLPVWGHRILFPDAMFHARSLIAYFALQLLAVYLTARFTFLWPAAEKRAGWLGMAATAWIMLSIYAVCCVLN
jgi:hypothetical protein